MKGKLEITKRVTKSTTSIKRDKHLKEMMLLLDKKVLKEIDKGSIVIRFTRKGNKHLYNDTLGRAKGLQKKDLKNLYTSLKGSIFVKSATLDKERNDSITKFYYFKDKDKELYYNVAEKRIKLKNGRETIHRFLYSVTDRII